jgi:hypothetical protein
MLPIIPEYWQAVARAIDAENAKASIFIKHNASIGAAREAILKDVLSRQTLDPYRVTSGFVFHPTSNNWCSLQCDVIVYDPSVARPYYAIGELAVVPREAASLVIEVKTGLDEEEFGKILRVWESVFWLPVPMLVFAYEGVRFQTFVEYLRKAIPTAPCGLPTCITVHRQNYLYMRAEYTGAENDALPNKRRPTKCQFAIDFNTASTGEGTASSVLLHLYNLILKERHPRIEWILESCRKLGVSGPVSSSTAAAISRCS